MRQESTEACTKTAINRIEIRTRRELGSGRTSVATRYIGKLIYNAQSEPTRAQLDLIGARWAVADMVIEMEELN